MNWFWLNVPLMAMFFLAITGIPLWLTFKHPDRRPVQRTQAGPGQVWSGQAWSGQAWSVPGQTPATIKVHPGGGEGKLPVPVLARR